MKTDKQQQKLSSGIGSQSALQVGFIATPGYTFGREKFVGSVQKLAGIRDHSQWEVWMQASCN